MDEYPKTLSELEAWFFTEESCRDYLCRLRWPEGLRCPRCGHEKTWPVGPVLFQCARCDYQVSVTAGTIFHGTHKPLRLWFRAIWWVIGQKNGASALGIQRILGLGSYRTAWAWLHRLRRAMVRPGRDPLAGVIEVDETYVGGERPGKRGRGAAGKVLVLISVEVNEDRIGRIRLRRVRDASAPSLEEAVQEAATPGAAIRTDGWIGYSQLERLGYRHAVVRKGADLGDSLLPSCHRVASLLKRWLMGTHQGAVSHEHLDYYLDEFTFRFNRRTARHRGMLFYRLLQSAVQQQPIPYRQLVKKDRA